MVSCSNLKLHSPNRLPQKLRTLESIRLIQDTNVYVSLILSTHPIFSLLSYRYLYHFCQCLFFCFIYPYFTLLYSVLFVYFNYIVLIYLFNFDTSTLFHHFIVLIWVFDLRSYMGVRFTQLNPTNYIYNFVVVYIY